MLAVMPSVDAATVRGHLEPLLCGVVSGWMSPPASSSDQRTRRRSASVLVSRCGEGLVWADVVSFIDLFWSSAAPGLGQIGRRGTLYC